jgi:hypothetical protein
MSRRPSERSAVKEAAAAEAATVPVPQAGHEVATSAVHATESAVETPQPVKTPMTKAQWLANRDAKRKKRATKLANYQDNFLSGKLCSHEHNMGYCSSDCVICHP